MLRLSKKLLFALEAVVDIAYHAGSEPVQSKEITRRQGIPHRYLEQVMQKLVRAGVLKGVRGPRGGYLLARERRRISVGEIARVVRGIEADAAPIEDTAGSEIGQLVLRPFWLELYDEMVARLDEMTVEDLCQRSYKAGIKSEARERLIYTI